MQRRLCLSILIGLVWLGWPSSSPAQVEVYLKGKPKPIPGVVAQDSVLGLRLKGTDLIPAEQIDDVLHTVEPTSAMIAVNTAFKGEKKSLAVALAEERLKALGDSIKRWEEVLVKVPATQFAARRHAEFKIAYLSALQAREEGKKVSLVLAGGRLEKFLKNNPDCWQYAGAMLTLADVQVAQGEFEAAEATFQKIAENPKLSEGTKHEAAFQVVRMAMNAKKYADAQKRIKDLAGMLPKDSPYHLKAQLAESECHAATGNINGASDILKKLLKDTKDRDVRAVAHNTLGYCYFQAKQYQDARWEFLWVDVVYNQNKAEHARALYYLHQIFRQLNDPDRAQECLEALLGSTYNGLEFQRRAQAEQKQ